MRGWITGVVTFVASLFVITSLNEGLVRAFYGGGPGERGLYMKLPLDLPRFHWQFASEEALLAGELEIEIVRHEGEDTVLTVFRDGEMGDGWRAMESDRGEGEVYFGFIFDGRVPTHADDSVIVRLDAVEDLHGMGRWYTAVLPAGTYEAVSSYGILTGYPTVAAVLGTERDDPTAYISCWRSRWPLQVTEHRGWMGTPEERGERFGGVVGFVEKVAPTERGTDGRVCVE